MRFHDPVLELNKVSNRRDDGGLDLLHHQNPLFHGAREYEAETGVRSSLSIKQPTGCATGEEDQMKNLSHSPKFVCAMFYMLSAYVPAGIFQWVFGVDITRLDYAKLRYVLDIVRILYQFLSVAILFGLFVGTVNGLALCLVRYFLTFRQPAIRLFGSSKPVIKQEEEEFKPLLNTEWGLEPIKTEDINPLSEPTSSAQLFDHSQHQIRERHLSAYYDDDDGYGTVRGESSPKPTHQSRISSRFSSLRSDSLFNTSHHHSESGTDTTVDSDRSELNIIKEEDLS
ncbi:hypothetical protein KL905_000043 [Ogataea polymorpha]|nr:hypothetical protein KL935_001620 [Ogataea polymorpha]KAG7912868.1 hypothetical protein KL907_001070 [Ogataea polymorpha]KAG7923889.1 hypothetical protein KL905_000043 [Ogataea polymorpha]KAG7936961.1 hypothetical protein KL934_001164 [Ogataea polymorpha]